MQWMIASDLHGSAYYARALVEAFAREGADRLVLLGDLLYHGPRNDLPREYAPQGGDPPAQRTGGPAPLRPGQLRQRGGPDGADRPHPGRLRRFGPGGERLVYCTHGHVWNRENLPPLRPGDLLLHGHTHVPAWAPFGAGNLCLNPGSWPSPRRAAPTAT